MIILDQYKAGTLENSPAGYQYFLPSRINDAWQWTDPVVNQKLELAAMRLGELNAFARLVPNVDLFIEMQVAAEAVKSTKIEGTQTSMDEAFLSEADVSPERKDDWLEVQNYISALKQAIQQLDKLPISTRLIKESHGTLLQSVRGKHKLPGEYRTSQNWIGGHSLATAVFVPPHHDHVHALMSDMENFLHNEQITVPLLIRIAIIHYQFETIHPFLDGNGRMGRLLISLILVDQKVQSKPLLYLSSYLENHKNDYYDSLTRVRTQHDLTQWLHFFLTAIIATADSAIRSMTQVLQLKEKIQQDITAQFGKRTKTATALFLHLLQSPVINVKEAEQATGLSFKAANVLVADFVKQGILHEMTGQSRNRLFVFDDYLKLF